jgi:hypothetical protein
LACEGRHARRQQGFAEGVVYMGMVQRNRKVLLDQTEQTVVMHTSSLCTPLHDRSSGQALDTQQFQNITETFGAPTLPPTPNPRRGTRRQTLVMSARSDCTLGLRDSWHALCTLYARSMHAARSWTGHLADRPPHTHPAAALLHVKPPARGAMQGPIALLARSVAAVDEARRQKISLRQKVTLVHTRHRCCRRPRTAAGVRRSKMCTRQASTQWCARERERGERASRSGEAREREKDNGGGRQLTIAVSCARWHSPRTA